jgi:5-methylthioadenosine/S-adenosylhomocysteine deaminase
MSTLIRNGVIVTMNERFDVVRGDLRFNDGQIEAVAPKLGPRADEDVVDAGGSFVIPGLIQAHTHLCQTLFRGLADDLELLEWLQKRIWPLEAAHDEESLRSAARLGLLEMQLLGTTAILDMGTTRLHEVVFEEARAANIRYWGGNCLMDLKAQSGPLYRATDETLAYCEELIGAWHRQTPLLEYAVSPRFAISCSEKILKAAAHMREKHDLLFHTHAAENRGEVALVKKRSGLDNVKYLKKLGCLSRKTVLAHGIHLSRGEVTDMIRLESGLTHCPSSNLKLASGIARIHEYRKRGLKVALGADGAACNNMMDPFVEMRLAALLQKPLFGPTALPARDAFELGTMGGAKVLNAENRIGSLEVGKRADLVIVRRNHPSSATVEDPYSALVYSSSGRDVSHVWVDGASVVRDGQHQLISKEDTIAEARAQLMKLRARARLK